MTATLTNQVLTRLRMAGLALPRAFPGQEWTPRTPAEEHLLSEGRRLDRLRMLLLEEVGRLRQQIPCQPRPRAEQVATAARTVERLKDCPLSQAQLGIVAAAAAGESPEETARRLCLSYDTVKSHRLRAVSRLKAHNIPHAVALCVAAGWVTDRQITEGVTP